MDHTAAPFVPRGSGLQPPTQPLTPPLAAQPGPGPLHFRNGPPYSAHYAPQAHQYAQLPPQYAAMPPPPSQPPAYRAPTKLRAGASEFVPPQKKSNTTTASPAKHADPTPTVVPPKSEESQLKLNASARPYSPNRGAPAFPATAPTSADAAAAAVVTPNTDATQGDTAFPTGTTPEPLSPVTPMSPTRDGSTYPTFKNSKLPVPEKPNAPTEVKLNSTWTLYADSHPISIGLSFGGGSFNASKEPQPTFAPTLLKNVGDMEGFWRLWRTIKPPSAQVASFTFFFFRRSINPTWEDARNKAGGTINVPLWDANRAGLLEREQVDDVWFLVTMLLAGESLPGANLFNGAVLKIRPRAITLQMWTNTSTQASLQPSADAFRQRLQQRFPQEKFEGLEFYSHANQEKAPASPVTPKPTAGGKAKKVQKKEADFKL